MAEQLRIRAADYRRKGYPRMAGDLEAEAIKAESIELMVATTALPAAPPPSRPPSDRRMAKAAMPPSGGRPCVGVSVGQPCPHANRVTVPRGPAICQECRLAMRQAKAVAPKPLAAVPPRPPATRENPAHRQLKPAPKVAVGELPWWAKADRESFTKQAEGKADEMPQSKVAKTVAGKINEV